MSKNYAHDIKKANNDFLSDTPSRRGKETLSTNSTTRSPRRKRARTKSGQNSPVKYKEQKETTKRPVTPPPTHKAISMAEQTMAESSADRPLNTSNRSGLSSLSSSIGKHHMRGKKRHYHWTKIATVARPNTGQDLCGRQPIGYDDKNMEEGRQEFESVHQEGFQCAKPAQHEDTKGKWTESETHVDDTRHEQPPLSTIQIPTAVENKGHIRTAPEKPVTNFPLAPMTNATPEATDEHGNRSIDSLHTVSEKPKRGNRNETSDDGAESIPDREIDSVMDDESASAHTDIVTQSNSFDTSTHYRVARPQARTAEHNEKHSTRVNPWPKRLKPLIGAISNAMAWKPKSPFDETVLQFESTMKAAERNLQILGEHNFDLQAIITGEKSKNTPLRPGSEFRPVELLNAIFHNHPLWPRVRRTLGQGFTMPLTDISDMDRVEDVYEALHYGNHKSTHSNPEIALEMLNEEVRYGWQLVLPAKRIPMIPGSIVAPLGLVKQTSINELGESVVKWRLTHDQSFKFQSETSVNSRVIKDKLANCLYGNALRRFLHAIVLYRKRFPTTPLLITKFDLKSAYRRAHFSGASALQSIATSTGLHNTTSATAHDGLAYVSLRLTFGGATNPSEFSLISEMIADLANILLQHKDWDPKQLHSEFISITNPTPNLVDDATAFATARELLYEWEMSDYGITEAYIDDIFTVFPLLSENHWERGRNAALLAIDTMGRPTHDEDHLPRDPIIALKKLKAEGTPSEVMVVLGWQIDTRRLRIQLPNEKATRWEEELDRLIADGDKGYQIKLKRLESIQGRNIHVASVVPGAMHFQSRIYAAIDRARNDKNRVTRLHAEERNDLRLVRQLVRVAKRGISLNNVVRRMPDHIGRSDAFEGGIGGYNLASGRAWRYQIQPEDRHQKSQNFLEYLACMTQLICILDERKWKQGDCILSVGDNTSALGWIHKSNFRPEEDKEQTTHLALARHITTLLAEIHVTQSGCWLPGKDNGVADTLSRQHDQTNAELTDIIVKSFPEQVPNGFRIRALTPEVTSWVRYWVQHTHATKESPPEPLQRVKCGGNGGSSSYTTVNLATMCISDNLHPTNATCSSELSHTRSAPVNGPCPRRAMITWLREHAAQRSTVCARPSSQPVGTIPARTRTANLLSFYDGKFEGRYKNNDPSEQPQKAIPFGLLQKIVTMPTKNHMRRRFQLLTHMAFFAMRSCEYLRTSGTRRTQPIRMNDITFRDRFNRTIKHDNPDLETKVEWVSLTFRFQKRDIRDDTITQSRSGHRVFCPVLACAAIVRDMLRDGNKPTDCVYRFLHENGTFADLHSKMALLMLRQSLCTINSEALNIKPEECGLHSLRSSAAMAMYLNGILVYTIMLLGRWSSDAFL